MSVFRRWPLSHRLHATNSACKINCMFAPVFVDILRCTSLVYNSFDLNVSLFLTAQYFLILLIDLPRDHLHIWIRHVIILHSFFLNNRWKVICFIIFHFLPADHQLAGVIICVIIFNDWCFLLVLQIQKLIPYDLWVRRCWFYLSIDVTILLESLSCVECYFSYWWVLF